MGKNGRTTNLIRPVEVSEAEVERMSDDETRNLDANTMDFDDGSEDSASEDSEMDENGDGEDDEWGGIQAGEDSPLENGGDKDYKGGGAKANVAPTRDEIRAMNEASELFKSNTFKLQIDALLPHVRPKESRVKPLEEFLRTLYTFLTSLPSRPPSHPLEAAKALRKKGITVPYPFPQPAEGVKWTVAFEKPSDINLVGSWPNKVGVKAASGSTWTVDVALEMPAALLQEKDYLDGRFFHKRAFYLASLAQAITSNKSLHVDAVYDTLHSDTRLSTLVLTSQKDNSLTDFSSLNASIRLLPVLPSPSPISLHHLSPSHSNLRLKSSTEADQGLTNPTPIYNASLLTCVAPRQQLVQTYDLIQNVPAFRDALALLRVWANQRGYGSYHDPRGSVAGLEGRGYFWTALLTVLVVGEESTPGHSSKQSTRRTVGKGLSSYQLFRAALDFLAHHDFSTERIVTKGGMKYPLDMYIRCPVFVDTCSTNVLAGVPLPSLDMLRHDAKATLNLLNKSSSASDPFHELFLQDQRQLHTRFDVVISVDLQRISLRKTDQLELIDFGSPPRYLIHTLGNLLKRGLGDRVEAIGIVVPPNGSSSLMEGIVARPLSNIVIGLVLDPTNAFRLVDHGPAASEEDTAEIVEFREFWGKKAELRRFKDGRIVESVVWEVKNSDERSRIPAMIVRHILEHHLGLDGEKDMKVVQSDFDDLLRIQESLLPLFRLGSTTPGFKGAMNAFDRLVRDLKGLDDEIPLSILNVNPISSDLRYTSVFAPIPIPSSNGSVLPQTIRFMQAMDVIIQFERSGRWPDDLKALQKMKFAFFERIASALMAKVEGLQASVVIADQQSLPEIADNSYLEVVTLEGWAFKVRIWHDREGKLLEQLFAVKKTLPNGARKPPVSGEPASAEKAYGQEAYALYVRRFIHAPKHHRAIASLIHVFPAYAGTVRLVKRWLSSHWLLAGHVREEAVELLCAYIFLGDSNAALQGRSDDALGTPGTKEAGFFRFVSLLSKWKWEAGLFVPVYSSDDSENDQEKDLVAIKAGSGSGVWTISTREDLGGRIWTRDGPSLLVARRIQALATSTMKYVQHNEKGSLVPKALFLHPITDYDMLINLDESAICRHHQRVIVDEQVARGIQKYANIPNLSGDSKMLPDFDPVGMFVQDLRRIYAGTLEFFHDTYGGSTIGAVWDQSVLIPRPFRVLADYSSIPIGQVSDKSKQKEQVKLNQSAVLVELQRLGQGLVKTIEVQKTHE